MQKLSVCEFKNLVNETQCHRIIFDSSNQDSCYPDETLSIKLVFDNIKVFMNPNTICLSSPNSSMWMKGVKYITKGRYSLLGDIYHVVCESSNPELTTMSHTIVIE